jgi:hypothetical protein
MTAAESLSLTTIATADHPRVRLPKPAPDILPRQNESKMFGGYGTGAPCAGCDLAIHPGDVEHELVFADGRAFAFHLACVNLWRALKDAPAGGEWRVTCSCAELIGFAETFLEAEALGREHLSTRKSFAKHLITIGRQSK